MAKSALKLLPDPWESGEDVKKNQQEQLNSLDPETEAPDLLWLGMVALAASALIVVGIIALVFVP